jgi:GNAT superfamily N-acetyltransferase
MADTEIPELIPVTVTFLEMHKPPAQSPSMPYNKPIALLKAKNMPLHFYRYLMDRVGRRWHWVNVLRLSDEELAAGLHREDRDIRVLYLDGAPAGFFDLKPHLPEEVELAYFGMMEHALGQGIGRWFLGAAIETAWSFRPQRVVVQTCTLDHPAALPLYQKLGFSPVGQKKEVVRPLTLSERFESVMRA